MRFFKQFKKDIYNWTNDIVGNNNRLLPVINESLDSIQFILNLWETNQAYIDIKTQLTMFIGKFYRFNNINVLLNYIKSTEFEVELTKLQNGENFSKNFAFVILKYLKNNSLTICQEKDYSLLINLLIEYYKIYQLAVAIRKDIIKNNYLSIYGKYLILNGIRQRNPEYANIIGEYENIENILGYEGQLLKQGDDSAINHIIELEDLDLLLKNKKLTIEMENQYYKR